ncbi:MAG TPA: potassium channel family protein [Acidobacteriota bacterium]|nr:potassium channel family protein [Acidobacteriota bacterium]
MNTLTSSYLQHRYMILFYSLLCSIIAVPLFSTLRIGAALPFLFAFNLLAAIVPIASARVKTVLLAMLFVILLIQLQRNTLQGLQASIGSLTIWTFVGLFAAIYSLRFTLKASEIHGEHIYAALSAYLLAGVFLGHFFWVLERIAPGSLLIGGAKMNGNFPISAAIYFSFVTLATLGYGDIVPASDVARAVAIVEAVAGQLYLAVMVARLVSLYAVRKQ